MAQSVEFVTLSSEDQFTLTFGSTLTGDACQASWGLDDVTISVL